MGRWRRTTACERARQWLSLELDDELSELERAALHRHLARCGRCSAIRTEIAGFTQLIRAAAPVQSLRPVVVERPRAARARVVRRTAAALVLAATIAGSAGVFVLPEATPPRSSSALELATPQERLKFAEAERVRAEPQPIASSTQLSAPPLWPFAARVLG